MAMRDDQEGKLELEHLLYDGYLLLRQAVQRTQKAAEILLLTSWTVRVDQLDWVSSTSSQWFK